MSEDPMKQFLDGVTPLDKAYTKKIDTSKKLKTGLKKQPVREKPLTIDSFLQSIESSIPSKTTGTKLSGDNQPNQHTPPNIRTQKSGNSPKQLRKLRSGKIKISHYCDIHGYTQAEAIGLLNQFMQEAFASQIRYGKIIHGKGLHSKDNDPVLKKLVVEYLINHTAVIDYCEAHHSDGGSGATYFLLRASH